MLRYQVQDMTCGHCVQTITQAVKAVAGRAEVKVDLAGKLVEVAGAGSAAQVEDAIRQAGYTPVAEPGDPRQQEGAGCCGHC